jgi:uncharacterized protein (TIGR02145 family)
MMKMLKRRVIEVTTVLIGATVLSGCGGGSGSGDPLQAALSLIADYAENNINPVPDTLDYRDAGIMGVSMDNLSAVNAMVDRGGRNEFDTQNEIQNMVDRVGPKAVPDPNFAAGHEFIYGVVTNPITHRTWINNNLGARYANVNDTHFDPQQQATSETDFLATGFLYQWGRKADGHEIIIRTGVSTPLYGTTAVQHDNPAHSLFIRSAGDWRVTEDNTLWANDASDNNVCPVGFRVPTKAEFISERDSWVSTNAAGALASNEMWVLTGLRRDNSGLIDSENYGIYWTKDASGVDADYFYFLAVGASISSARKAFGMAIRCIKN